MASSRVQSGPIAAPRVNYGCRWKIPSWADPLRQLLWRSTRVEVAKTQVTKYRNRS